MKLTPTMHRCVLHWGEMAGRWGVSRSVAQIHAPLFLAPSLLTADADSRDPGMWPRSNVSVSLKELQAWDLVSVTINWAIGGITSRRARIWEVLTMIMDGRKKREIDLTLQMLRECSADAKKDHETRPSR